jgi:hypothetical protein
MEMMNNAERILNWAHDYYRHGKQEELQTWQALYMVMNALGFRTGFVAASEALCEVITGLKNDWGAEKSWLETKGRSSIDLARACQRAMLLVR